MVWSMCLSWFISTIVVYPFVYVNRYLGISKHILIPQEEGDRFRIQVSRLENQSRGPGREDERETQITMTGE